MSRDENLYYSSDEYRRKTLSAPATKVVQIPHIGVTGITRDKYAAMTMPDHVVLITGANMRRLGWGWWEIAGTVGTVYDTMQHLSAWVAKNPKVVLPGWDTRPFGVWPDDDGPSDPWAPKWLQE